MSIGGLLDKASAKKIKPFSMHGVSFEDVADNQVVGDCPFCAKENHFYVNYENQLWDCKVCAESGNLITFIEKINDRNKDFIERTDYENLAEDRELPIAALKTLELGYDGRQYTIAVRNHLNKVTDLRIYRPRGRAISTSGAKLGLLNLNKVVKSQKKPIYICEGEWDAAAMQWLLDNAKKPGIAVCVPGAGTFKPEWAEFLGGKDVHVIYDNDAAGIKGEKVILDRLNRNTKRLRFIHWDQGLPDGWDLRDHVIKNALPRKTPKKAFRLLSEMERDRPRGSIDTKVEAMAQPDSNLEIDTSVTIQDLVASYESFLHKPNKMGIEACVVTMLASVFGTNPVWLFIVAPPSSGKTAIINGFRYLTEPHDDTTLAVSHLTTHSLISGMQTKHGDPSVFAQLDGKKMTLFIKDFTPVIAMRDSDKEDIYGQLRDAYDGYTSKPFGNGVKRTYQNLKFGIIAGVTEMIYDESVNFQALGERFGKLSIGHNNDDEFSINAIDKSIANMDSFADLEDQCAKIAYSCVKNLIQKAEDQNFKLPKISDDLRKAITHISMYVSIMRGCVSRDRYRRDYIKSAPYSETGIRFAKMMAAIAAIRAFVYDKEEADMDDFDLIRKIALDTVNQRDEELLRIIHKLSLDESQPSIMKNIVAQSRYTPYTIRCILDDFSILGITHRKKVGRKTYFNLSDRMSDIINNAKLYEKDISGERKVKVRAKRSKKGQGRFSIKKKKTSQTI